MGYPRRRFALAGQCEMDIQSETKSEGGCRNRYRKWSRREWVAQKIWRWTANELRSLRLLSPTHDHTPAKPVKFQQKLLRLRLHGRFLKRKAGAAKICWRWGPVRCLPSGFRVTWKSLEIMFFLIQLTRTLAPDFTTLGFALWCQQDRCNGGYFALIREYPAMWQEQGCFAVWVKDCGFSPRTRSKEFPRPMFSTAAWSTVWCAPLIFRSFFAPVRRKVVVDSR